MLSNILDRYLFTITGIVMCILSLIIKTILVGLGVIFHGTPYGIFIIVILLGLSFDLLKPWEY